MVDGRERAEWWHTAAIRYEVYCSQPRKGGSKMKPGDFHPMERKPKHTSVSLKELGRTAFGVKT